MYVRIHTCISRRKGHRIHKQAVNLIRVLFGIFRALTQKQSSTLSGFDARNRCTLKKCHASLPLILAFQIQVHCCLGVLWKVRRCVVVCCSVLQL